MNINTRADLDAIAGTPEHAAFLSYLNATITHQADQAVYPQNYDHTLQPGQTGYVAPNWQTITDLSVITRFGYTQETLAAAIAAGG